MRGRARPLVARHGSARAPRASSAPRTTRCRKRTPAARRTGRPKRVTRREAGHSRTPVSVCGVGLSTGCSSLTSWVCTSSIDALCFGVSARRFARSTLVPWSLALAGARDEGRAIGAAHRPRARFDSGPGATRSRALRSKGRGVPRVPRAAVVKTDPRRPPRVFGSNPFRGKARGRSWSATARCPIIGGSVSDWYGRHGPPQPTAREVRGAHVAPQRTTPIKAGVCLTAPPSASDRAGANLAGPRRGTQSAADGAPVSGSGSR